MTQNADKNQDNQQALNALKQHGSKILWAIILVLAAFFGWQYYQNHYAKVDVVAADSYASISQRNDAVILAEQNPDLDDTAKKALADDKARLYTDIDKLVAEHGDSVYAWQALMLKARHQSDEEDYQAAADSLNQAAAIKLDDAGLMAITDLRLAQVLLAKGDADGAKAVMQKALPEAFEASKQEVLGDIYVAKNDIENAKAAYTAAWESLRDRQEERALLSLKLQSLGVEVEPISTPSVVIDEQSAQITEATH
ncbi:tetratricopeptide repeat protein [Moraxella nasovis]|uniref:YfgM family protein n=1 Tax=Moraxella nasovis TaxID=2904121 RepID=UPI001F60CD9E|nr:tetratricopeptide repeat protein [Moraxella nasovis]UNU73554.1 tetratricopeptide repeat protein [Moraxella nasovis]